MGIRNLVIGFACAVGLFGQYKKRTSWEDKCFNNPAAPYCSGSDYATKPPPKDPAKASKPTIKSPTGAPRSGEPTMITVGAIDWAFADPFADAIAGFDLSALAASPMTRGLIFQLAAKQGVAEADAQKILDNLSGVGQVAFSVHGKQAVVMVTGGSTDLTSSLYEPGLKAVPLNGNAMLVGHADAVDRASRRMELKLPLGDLPKAAAELQSANEFWAIGSAGFAGPQAVSAGVRRVLVAISIKDRVTSDVAVEFYGVPNTEALKTWQATGSRLTVEGATVHIRTSMEADEVNRKVGEIVASPLGERLAVLIEAARYLPAPNTEAVPKRTKPVIYGLDDGPREVN